jgi:hypothetical protein
VATGADAGSGFFFAALFLPDLVPPKLTQARGLMMA